jgi:hypothetical protein
MAVEVTVVDAAVVPAASIAVPATRMCLEAAELLLLLQGSDGGLGCRQSSLLQGTALAQ